MLYRAAYEIIPNQIIAIYQWPKNPEVTIILLATMATLGKGVFTPRLVRRKECHCHNDGIHISNDSNIH